MRWRLLAVATALLATTLPSVLTPATAAGPAAPFDHVGGGNVTPPGNSGHVPSPQLAATLAGSYQAPHSDDQRALYTDWKRKDWSFTHEGDTELGAATNPAGRTDVRVYYDTQWGVPHIFGDTDAAAQFGVGYAMASQRMFQADVFRHVARGEMAQFLGGQSWFDYDRVWRKTFYTDAELLDMFERYYTPEERDLVQAYLDGVNAYIDEALQDPNKLPGEYVALGIVPEKWELRHALAVFVLQARDSVEGFGLELYNAGLLAELQQRLGKQAGAAAFTDLRSVRDPGSYTTAPDAESPFPYPGGGFGGLQAEGVAMPDSPASMAQIAREQAILAKGLSYVGLERKQASNAITVTPELAKDGRAVLLGGPQLAYMIPGIFWEFEVHGATQHARGIGFAGTAGVVLIGKTPTHAWSITYGYTDQVDTFMVPLDPQRPDTHYLRAGESKPLQTYTSTVTCKIDQVSFATAPSAEPLCDGAPVASEDVEVVRVPEYGPVVGRVTIGGKPYAVARTSAHWMREVANGRPFITLNRASTRNQIRAAQSDFNVALNINYVDDHGNAGFWHVARPPIRAEGTDVRLPTLGTGEYDWRGFVPLRDVPHAINPEQGYTVNWNNQPGRGWHNGDSNSWADVQRVDMLARRLKSLAARGDITPGDIWAVNRHAAHQDARINESKPLLLAAFDAGPNVLPLNVARALQLVRSWDGQRTSSQESGTWLYDDAAVLIWDRFYTELQHRLMADELGEDRYGQLMTDLDVDFYYLSWPLTQRIIKGANAPLPTRHDWLDGKSANAVMRAAFTEAVTDLAEEGGGDPSSWRGQAAMTSYQEVGVSSVDPHPQMNRGTYNQLAVVDVVD